MLLFTFLKKNLKKKVMVFFSSCASVKFHNKFFNHVGLPTKALHGKMKQKSRSKTFKEFKQQKRG